MAPVEGDTIVGQTGSQQNRLYTGRFAPSPSGDLHTGSLYTALASFLQARSKGGRWYVRIDDLDRNRTVPGSVTAILNTLERFGLHWDGPVRFQRQCLDAYHGALERLKNKGLIYACNCTRKKLAALTDSSSLRSSFYPGYCRDKNINTEMPHALRVRTGNAHISYIDGLHGPMHHHLGKETGDFIVRRRDDVFAYQLAVVTDDDEQAITEVVRGGDLLDSTPRQIYLQQMLGMTIPDYLHVPVLVNACGEKLSKHTHSEPVDETQPAATLWSLLRGLNQSPPPGLKRCAVPELINWAIYHWDAGRLPRSRTLLGPIKR